MTHEVSANYAQQNFQQIIEKAQQESEGVIIVKGDRKYVLIEQSKIKDLQETEQFEQLPNLFRNVSPFIK